MRKSAQRRSAVLPMNAKNRVKTELPALLALEAIGETWFSPQHQMDLLAVALVVTELAEPDSVQAICAAELQRLCSAPITLEEKVDVAMKLAECLPWLQLQQNVRVQAALEKMIAGCGPTAETQAQALSA
ncbi:hypothetical protein DLREEDagrD3_16650 [Denitratisoma sp. agr-D3]